MPSSISAEGGPPRSVGRLARVLACDGARRALPLRLGSTEVRCNVKTTIASFFSISQVRLVGCRTKRLWE